MADLVDETISLEVFENFLGAYVNIRHVNNVSSNDRERLFFWLKKV